MDRQEERKTQIDKFLDAARELETDDREDNFDALVQKIARPISKPKVCPECGHVFQGDGWDGIDSHWREKHEHVMPYTEAWPLISSGTYPRR